MENVLLQHNIRSARLVMEAPAGDGDYQIPMLLYNEPEGLLAVSECYEGTERRLYYDVTGACPLSAMMMRGTFDHSLIISLIKSLNQALKSAGDYMLDGTHISLQPEFIYYKDEAFLFCYNPFAEADFDRELEELAVYMTEHVKSDDPAAAAAAARLYRIALDRHVDIETLGKAVEEPRDEKTEEDPFDDPEFCVQPPEEEEPVSGTYESGPEKYPLWSELIEESDKRSGARRKKREKRGRRGGKEPSVWGDWSAFRAENG